MSLWKKIFGNPNARLVQSLWPIVEKINGLEPQFLKLNDEELRNQTAIFRERLAKGETEEDLLPEVFAAVREAARRAIGQRHFDVQLLGGLFLHKGYIAEMRTGEGKTLTATAAVYLNALSGKGVHVVTVNDYLAKRDAVWMGRIYNALGLTVGCIQQLMTSFVYEPGYQSEAGRVLSQSPVIEDGEKKEEVKEALVKVEPSHLRPVGRREAYACDILYGTNNEFGFDYLRDNMAVNRADMSQRELNYAVVDEIDSILIDEARTPLIISAPAEEATDKYFQFATLVRDLQENEDYNVDEKMRAATFTEAGITKLEERLKMKNIYAEGGVQTVHHLEQALRAQVIFKRDRDYVVKDGEVIIVDEFTGRLMFGRRYSEGLHQAIEAKEGANIQRESQTLATITFQNYFRLYKKLSGMTGTAATEAEEFSKIYNLEVVEVPTHRPMIRKDLPDRIYKSELGKFQAVVREVKERYEKGQPVLIGTISIEKNEILGELLSREGVPHQMLNAKNHEKEAEIISQAGQRGAVTLATNMAGRGVDIILGNGVRELGGLHVLGTERHESRRIDNQLRGRSGRQGDMGSSQFYVSMEDDLMRIFGSERIQKMMEFLKVPEDMPIENSLVSKSLESAQKKVEGNNFDIRKHLLEYDDVLNKHRTVIYKRRREILDEYERAKSGTSAPELTAPSTVIPSETSPKARQAEESLETRVLETVEKEIEQLVFFHSGGTAAADWNIQEIAETTTTIFSLQEKERTELIALGEKGEGRLGEAESRTAIIDYLVKLACERYTDLKKRINNSELMLEIEKSLLLRAIDTLWVEHLVAIDYLRIGIGLRGYGQRDPLVEYKKEAYRLFSELTNMIQKEVAYSIFKVEAALQMAPSLAARQGVRFSGAAKEADDGVVTMGQAKEFAKTDDGDKVGRNDLCPCGSGKKYKKCHGKG